MKTTIYTVTDCKFSADEKTYLQSKGIQFEEKNLETNRDFLTEMLQKSNNFAGTPVTEIVKDDGTTVVIKGFTQSEFDAALGGGAPVATPAQDPAQQTPDSQAPADQPQAPAQPPVSDPTSPVMPTPGPVAEPEMPQTNEAASAMSIPDPIPAVDTTPIAPPAMNAPQPLADNTTPQMPNVAAGQVLSDNISAPVSTPSISPSEVPSITAEPQGGPLVDPAASTGGTQDMAMPATPGQPAAQEQNPLNSVLNDLQSKANS